MQDLVTTRPFLKWPGGKFRQVALLKSYLPLGSHFIEPFVGAGALFLNTDYSQVCVNDINADLINLYQQIQSAGKKFIVAAEKFFIAKFNCPDNYYKLRKRFNRSDDIWEKSLLFLYLNRHGYNGLCRYNQKGGYNVPFGEYRRPYFPYKELSFFYERSQSVTFHCQDYIRFLNQYLERADLKKMVFYCDPPYVPLSSSANFTSYSVKPFSLEDQQQLAFFAQKLASKGATILISNHDTPFTKKIYQEAICHKLESTRTISCHTKTRKKVSEIIACFSPKA